MRPTGAHFFVGGVVSREPPVGAGFYPGSKAPGHWAGQSPRPYGRKSCRAGPVCPVARKRHIGGPTPLQALSVTFGDSSPIGKAKSGTPAKKDAEPGGSASLGCVISQYPGSFSSRRIWGRAASSPCSFSSRSHRSSRSLVSWLMRMWSLDF